LAVFGRHRRPASSRNQSVARRPSPHPRLPPLLVPRHPKRYLFQRVATRVLVKPAEFYDMVGVGARCHGGAPFGGKEKSHPVEPFVDLADECFVGMLFESIESKELIELFDCFAQMPTGFSKDEKIIQVAHIDELGAGRECLIDGIQVKGG